MRYLLSLQSLFDLGLRSLKHTHTLGYYSLILMSEKPGDVAVGAKQDVYNHLLLASGERAAHRHGSPATRASSFRERSHRAPRAYADEDGDRGMQTTGFRT